MLCTETGKLLEFRHLRKGTSKDRWEEANTREVGRLLDGRHKTNTSGQGTNTITFLHPLSIPKDKKATYLRVCANYRPQKADPFRIRWTVGGNLIVYNGETYTPNADIITAKLLFNSILSTKHAKFLGIDLKDFYLGTEMPHPEYMLVQKNMLPEEIIQEYNLSELFHKGNILARINKGMYGLPQAGRIAYDKLVTHLQKGGYVHAGRTPGLFKHKTRDLYFCLVVDDFGVKYVHKADAHHLINHLSKEYKCTVDWDGKIFLGIHLDWNYDKRTVDLSMPNYVTKARHIFNHQMPTTPEHSPHPYTAPRYGKHQQMVNNPTIRSLTPANRKIIERFVGLFQYYGRTLDGTMLASISSIATNMTTAQQKDLDFRIKQFLNYAATHPDAKIRFIASEMHLWIHSDASYLTEPKARSRAGGFFYLSKKPNLPIDPSQPAPPDNGPILILCKILDTIMS